MPNKNPAARVERHPLAWPLAAAVLLAGAALMAPRAEAGGSPYTTASSGDDSTDRLIVHYRGETGSGRRSALAAGAPRARTPAPQDLQTAVLQAQSVHRNGLGAQVLHLNRSMRTADLDAVARQIMADDPNVLYAEPDRKLHALAVPTDPLYASQWHYFETNGGLNLPAAWDLATGEGVVVAVIDTGVRAHEDLADNLLSGYDFVSNSTAGNDGNGRDSDANDPGDGCNGAHSSWHGTHVAGTIAAVTNNGLGGAGVAYDAKILPVRVLGCGGGYFSDIADGVLWASGSSVGGVAAPSQPARVLNLSLGGKGSCSTTMQSAINTARANGAVVIVAAGNDNESAGLHTPANCNNVVTVAAIGRNGGKASYSNYGDKVELAAPGGNMNTGSANGVLSTLNSGVSAPGSDNYAYYQGTSMATPHVAGVAALMLSRNPSLTADEVAVLLKSTTRAFKATCTGCGRGVVDAAAAVRAVFAGTEQANDADEVEPNNTAAQAQALTNLPRKVAGRISSSTDIDQFKVGVGVGQTVKARLISNLSSNYDLSLRNAAGTVLVSSARGAGMPDEVSWKNTSGVEKVVTLRVVRVTGLVGETGTYTLEVAKQ